MRDTFDMAREAGDDWDSTLSTDKEFLKRFEALVRADERAALVQEPVAQWQKRHPARTAGKWKNTNEHDAKWWRDNAQGWDIRALYTTPPAPVPLTDEQVDSATKAWFENDIVAGRNPFGKRMRAAFAAAHGITEKGQP